MLSANPDTSTSYVDVASQSLSLQFCHEQSRARCRLRRLAGVLARRKAVVLGPIRGEQVRRRNSRYGAQPLNAQQSFSNTHAAHRQNDHRRVAAGRIVGAGGPRADLARRFRDAAADWRDSGGDGRYRIVQQERISTDKHSGNGCEWLRLETENGGHIYLAHDVGRPSIIEELTPSVWVKSDRPGLQLAARIVLPRTTDPHTGRPVATTIVGSSYNSDGRWQQLQIARESRAC